MRVLMVAPQPFFEPRGTPISVYQRLHALSELGYEVDLVTYHVGNDVVIPGVTIHRTPRLPLIKQVRIGPSLAKVPLDIMLFFKTLWLLLARRYDVIHSHEEAAFFSMVLAAVFRTKHLYDMHSSLPRQLQNSTFGNCRALVKVFEVLEGLALKTCDVVLTVGSDLEDYVLYVNRRANHLRIENIAIYGSDVTYEQVTVAKVRERLGVAGKLAIVYTGNFERYQGLELLFESAQIVVREHPEVIFVMVGGKPEQVAAYQQRVRKMGLANHVTFTGIVALDESLRYLELAEILVSPRVEGLSIPLKIYSYLHSGKPMVATNIYAHRQILNGETAVVVDPNSGAYAKGLLQLIENPGLRAEIGRRAQAYAQQAFSREGYLSKLESAYLALKLCKRISEITESEVVGRAHSTASAG